MLCIFSLLIALIRTGEPKVIVSPSSPVSVTAGNMARLECAAAGDPAPSVQWIAPENALSSPQAFQIRPGVLSLVIDHARPEDQGNYTCQADNLVGTARQSVELIGKSAIFYCINLDDELVTTFCSQKITYCDELSTVRLLLTVSPLSQVTYIVVPLSRIQRVD